MTEHEHSWADIHGVIGCGACRIAKDDLWDLATAICPLACKHDITDHSGDCYDLADFILSRWRLVPVEQPTTLDQERDKWASAYFGVDIAAQRRAADELTYHDQAAGIYESNGIAYCHECNERLTRGHARGCHSTDQHGPHED